MLPDDNSLEQHISTTHANAADPQPTPPSALNPDITSEFRDCGQSFRGAIKTHRHEPKTAKDPIPLLNELRQSIERVLHGDIQIHGSIKWYICVHVALERSSANGTENVTLPIRSRNSALFPMSDLTADVSEAIDKVKTTLGEMEIRGSGWRIVKTVSVDLHIVKHKPMLGSSFISTPNDLKHKNTSTLINIHNADNKCFIYSVLAALYSDSISPEKRSDPDMYQPFEDRLDFSMISEPTAIDAHQLQKFQESNGISINIYGHEGQKTFPIHVASEIAERHVDLLYISKGTVGHYLAIKSLESLLFEQFKSNTLPVCRSCLHQFQCKAELARHAVDCRRHPAQKVTFPEPGTKVKFASEYKKQRVGSIVYADLESVLIPDESAGSGVLQHHKVCSAAGLMISDDDTPPRRFLQRARPDSDTPDEDGRVDEQESDLLPNFFQFLSECAENAYRSSRKNLKMTAENEADFQKATHCWICSKRYEAKDVRTRDHDHVSEYHFHSNPCSVQYLWPGCCVTLFFAFSEPHGWLRFDVKALSYFFPSHNKSAVKQCCSHAYTGSRAPHSRPVPRECSPGLQSVAETNITAARCVPRASQLRRTFAAHRSIKVQPDSRYICCTPQHGTVRQLFANQAVSETAHRLSMRHRQRSDHEVGFCGQLRVHES